MTLELTLQQRQLVKEQDGRPVEIVDPDTQRSYMLVARELFERARPMLDNLPPAPASSGQRSIEIPPGIRRSQEAFWRDLQDLLKQRSWRGQWVCYCGDERIGIAKTKTKLVWRCLKRGLDRREFYVGYIEERFAPPWETTVLEESLFEGAEKR
jgi:hypothetical protein